MQGEDLETTVRLTLREVLTGVSRRVQLSEPAPCPTCGGTGKQRGNIGTLVQFFATFLLLCTANALFARREFVVVNVPMVFA